MPPSPAGRSLRLLSLLISALIVALLGLAGNASAATVTYDGSTHRISISFTATGATPETVYVYSFGSNWRISGDISGTNPLDIPMADSCDFLVSDAGGGSAQTLVFAPALAINDGSCNPRYFKMTTLPSGPDQLQLSGDIRSYQSGSALVANVHTTLIADTTLQLNNVSLNGFVNGAHDLAVTADTALLPSRIGGTTPLSSLSVAATAATTLGNSVTTTGAQSYSGAVRLSPNQPITLAANALTLGGSGASDTVTNSSGTLTTLTVDVADTSAIHAALGTGTSSERAIALTKAGTGTLELRGVNDYTGATAVNAGRLAAITSAALGSDTAGTRVAGGATLDLRLGVANIEPLTLAADATLAASTPLINANLGGDITLEAGNQTIDLTGGGRLNAAGDISGATSGAGAITVTGNGRLTLNTVGATRPIASLWSFATTRLLGPSVTTTGNQSLDGPVELGGATHTLSGNTVSIGGNVSNVRSGPRSTLTIAAAGNSSIAGALGTGAPGADTAKIDLVSQAPLRITGTGVMDGTITANAPGSIDIDGPLPNAGLATSNSELRGHGPIGDVLMTGTGNMWLDAGTFQTGDVTLAAAGYLSVDTLNPGVAGVDYPQLQSTGDVNLNGSGLFLASTPEVPLGTTFDIIQATGTVSGTLAGMADGDYRGTMRFFYRPNGVQLQYVGPPPDITGIAPNSGTASGGTRVTITGSGLLDETTVAIGGRPCVGVDASNDWATLTCTTPAGVTGTADVTVTNLSRSATVHDAFTYTPAPASASGLATAPTSGDGGALAPRRTATIGRPRVVGARLVTTITLPGAGRITQTATTRQGRKRTVRCRTVRMGTAARTLRISCPLNPAARAARRAGPLRLRVRTLVTPVTGTPVSRTATVVARRTAR